MDLKSKLKPRPLFALLDRDRARLCLRGVNMDTPGQLAAAAVSVDLWDPEERGTLPLPGHTHSWHQR